MTADRRPPAIAAPCGRGPPRPPPPSWPRAGGRGSGQPPPEGAREGVGRTARCRGEGAEEDGEEEPPRPPVRPAAPRRRAGRRDGEGRGAALGSTERGAAEPGGGALGWRGRHRGRKLRRRGAWARRREIHLEGEPRDPPRRRAAGGQGRAPRAVADTGSGRRCGRRRGRGGRRCAGDGGREAQRWPTRSRWSGSASAWCLRFGEGARTSPLDSLRGSGGCLTYPARKANANCLGFVATPPCLCAVLFFYMSHTRRSMSEQQLRGLRRPPFGSAM